MVTRQLLGGAAFVVVALACAQGPTGPTPEQVAAEAAVRAAVYAAVEAKADAIAVQVSLDDRDPARRERTQPDAWKRGRILPFGTAVDRKVSRAESLQGRAERRAYDVAPPVIPHSAIFGEGTKTCLDCHLEGMALGKRIAHPMSHPPFASCLQCHVETSNRQFPLQVAVATSFVGRPSPGPGRRQSALAPPQIPHDIEMRGQCLSCHGEFGYAGLRTTHPERANCVQCHVVGAGASR